MKIKANAPLLASISVIFVIYVVWWAYDEHQVKFVSGVQTANFIQKDDDKYIARLSSADLVARKATSRDEYKLYSMQAASNFSEFEKFKLKQAVRKADAYFKTLEKSMPYFKHNKSLHWQFARTSGIYYEGGHPHTRKDIIFITDGVMTRQMQDIVELVIHERIHVLQRQFPKETTSLFLDIGFTKVGVRADFPCARANPDLDENIYAHPQMLENRPWVSCYTSETPSSIQDVTTEDIFEHPFEYIAYTLASQYQS